MTALFESLLLTVIHDVYSMSTLTYLHFSQVRKLSLDKHPLHRVWLNIPEWSSELMLELRKNQPNDISLGWMIQSQVRQYNLR